MVGFSRLWQHIAARGGWLAACALLLCAALLHAQPVAAQPVVAQVSPDAGSVLRQTERPAATPLPPAAPPAVPAAAPAAAADAGTRVVVKQFSFAGHTLVSDAALQQVTAAFLNRPLSLTELQAAAMAVAARYRAEGWLARALLPPQDISGGVVQIQVQESRLGKLVYAPDAAAKTSPASAGQTPIWRLPEAAITARLLARQAPGQPLRLPDLDRAVLVADDLPGVAVSASLAAGTVNGQTDLVVRVLPEPAWSGDVTLDNQGGRSTGEERISARLSWASPLGLGERFDLQALATSGNRYGRLAASLPLGNDGLRAEANLSALRYEVDTPEFASLAPSGTARSAGLQLSYPVLRTPDRNLFAGAGVQRKSLENRTVLDRSSDYSLDSAEMRLQANRYDNVGRGGVTTATLSAVVGRVNLNGSPNQAADALTANTQGRFDVLRYSVQRQQALPANVTLALSWQGQWASKNLDSSERFSLGGPAGVRAYPVSEGSGSAGNLVNVEARWRPPVDCRCTVSAFYDWGRVTVNRDADFPGAPSLNRYALKGYGVALNVAAPAGFALQATLAMRQGNNPAATLAGNDQDGSLRKARAWLSLSRSF